MKRHLFYTFLCMFGVTYVVTLLGILGVVHIESGYLPGLFTAFISETAVAVIALFRGTHFFTDDDKHMEQSVARLQESHRQEIAAHNQREKAMMNDLAVFQSVAKDAEGQAESRKSEIQMLTDQLAQANEKYEAAKAELQAQKQENAQLRARSTSGPEEDQIAGLSFLDLKNLLETEGLLSFFDEARKYLVAGAGLNDDNAQTRALAGRELIERKPPAGYFRLTENGRVF
jgi:hypothetical protein